MLVHWARPREATKNKRTPVDSSVKLKDLKEDRRIIDGIQEIFGSVFCSMDSDNLIKNTEKDDQWNEVLENKVLARFAKPSSKLASSELLKREFDKDVPVRKIYRMLDHLANHDVNKLTMMLNGMACMELSLI